MAKRSADAKLMGTLLKCMKTNKCLLIVALHSLEIFLAVVEHGSSNKHSNGQG